MILDMCQALRCSSSGGQVVYLQLLVSSLSVSCHTVNRLRADCSPQSALSRCTVRKTLNLRNTSSHKRNSFSKCCPTAVDRSQGSPVFTGKSNKQKMSMQQR